MAPHPCRQESLVSPVTVADCWSDDTIINLKKIWAGQRNSDRPMQRPITEQPSAMGSIRNNDMRSLIWGNYDIWRTETLVDVCSLQSMTGLPHTVSATPLDSAPIICKPVLKDPLPPVMFGTVDGKLVVSSRSTVDDRRPMNSISVEVNSSIKSCGSEGDVELPIDSPYMTFTERSPSRTYEVLVLGKSRDTHFYINFEEIQNKANKLAELLERADGQAPQIRVDVRDFEIFLRFLCGSYNSETRRNAIGKYIDIILTLAQRFSVYAMIIECKKFVLQTDFCAIDLLSLRRYFEAFESTGVDVLGCKQGSSRPVRSHIISGLICAGRWPEFNRLLGKPFYNAAIENGLKRGNLSPAAVNLHLHKFFFMYGNSLDHSGQEVDAKNALQAIFPNVRVTCNGV